MPIRERIRDAPAGDKAMLVTDSIPDSLAEIRSKRMRAARIEYAEPPEQAQQDVLDQIGRVGRCSRPVRKPAVGPAPKLGKIATEKVLNRARIAIAGAFEKTPRRLTRGLSLPAPNRSQRQHSNTSPLSAMLRLEARTYMSHLYGVMGTI